MWFCTCSILLPPPVLQDLPNIERVCWIDICHGRARPEPPGRSCGVSSLTPFAPHLLALFPVRAVMCWALSRTRRGWDRGAWRKEDVWSPVACGKWPKWQVPQGRASALSPAPKAASCLHCQTPARSEDGDHAARTFPTEHKGFGKFPEVGANSSVSSAK